MALCNILRTECNNFLILCFKLWIWPKTVQRHYNSFCLICFLGFCKYMFILNFVTATNKFIQVVTGAAKEWEMCQIWNVPKSPTLKISSTHSENLEEYLYVCGREEKSQSPSLDPSGLTQSVLCLIPHFKEFLKITDAVSFRLMRKRTSGLFAAQSSKARLCNGMGVC